ncbi:cell division protein FtsZ [candidate division WWE3 bacterium RIFCSPLOWO2_01_FULL_39_13]|uniref:Cell division protein FtsZ n=1 Tax=candidate division WWE3 bacterium RIFCSPLOWO2_01_FULL_39_13 TaxID=1802624 RepID=A0A1F4V2A7_UNCKA|nr:MAG: cell division protein FtsZ [candidate division WWE3 bacterium RIFCSPLOWO2_01_FULL_39_13]
MAFIEPKTGNLARIRVIGVGGGGQNAVNSMIESNSVEGVEFIAMNTDMQALNTSSAQVRIQLGPEKTHGLGSGGDPNIGFEATKESLEDIKSHLQGSDMVFITAGMGGGTGTGGAPVVSQVAKETGALSIGVVTRPFLFEGKRRMSQAEQGIRELKEKVDALIVIPNEKLLEIVDENVSFKEAFKIADEVVGKAVEGISELINSTGLVNVDFADVKAVMQNAGSALMGIGQADGENRAEKAARAAVNSPLLDIDIKGSTGILLNIVGDPSMTMHEVNTAAKLISSSAHDAANIIFGANIDPNVEGIRVTVIATGFDSSYDGVLIPEYSSYKEREVIDQIDSRFDDNTDEGDAVSDADKKSKKIKDKVDEEDLSEFNIDNLRKQVHEMESGDSEKDSKPDKETKKSDENDGKKGKKKESETKEEGSEVGGGEEGDSKYGGSFFDFLTNRKK